MITTHIMGRKRSRKRRTRPKPAGEDAVDHNEGPIPFKVDETATSSTFQLSKTVNSDSDSDEETNRNSSAVAKRKSDEEALKGEPEQVEAAESGSKRRKIDGDSKENEKEDDGASSDFFSKMKFGDLDLAAETQTALREGGFERMTPIQAKAIPPLLRVRMFLRAPKQVQVTACVPCSCN